MHHRGPWTQRRLKPDESTAVSSTSTLSERSSDRVVSVAKNGLPRLASKMTSTNSASGTAPIDSAISARTSDRSSGSRSTVRPRPSCSSCSTRRSSSPISGRHQARGRDHQDLAVRDQPGETHQQATESLSASWRSSHTITTVSTSASWVTRSNSALRTSRGTSSVCRTASVPASRRPGSSRRGATARGGVAGRRLGDVERQVADDLAGESERHSSIELCGVTGEAQCAHPSRPVQDLCGESGLADSAVAADQREGATAAFGRLNWSRSAAVGPSRPTSGDAVA